MDRHQQELAMDTVRDLVETCRDSEAGFLRAARRSQKTGLKEFMGAEALQKALFVAELELELKKLGVSAKPLTPRPAKVRGWKEIRGTCL